MKTPAATRKEHIHHDPFGGIRPDHYHWMRLSDEQKNSDAPDSQAQRVVSYLDSENAYTSAQMASTGSLQAAIYQEIVGRLAPDEESVPYDYNGYTYKSSFSAGAEYPVYSRRQIGGAVYDTLLDVNVLATNQAYYKVASLAVSPDNHTLIYAEDTVGRRQYTLRFRRIKNNAVLAHTIPDTTGQAIWAEDSETIFYVVKDEALRPHRVMRYSLATGTSALVYEETDEKYRVYIGKTKSEKYIIIGAASSLTTEYRYIAADRPSDLPTVFAPRSYKEEYHITHHGDRWLIRTNKDADNFKMMHCPLGDTGRGAWQTYLPYDASLYIQGVDVTAEYLVLSVRYQGQTELWVKAWTAQHGQLMKMDEEAYTIYPGTNRQYDTTTYRVSYTSMTTPVSTIEVDLSTFERKVLKTQKIVGDFDKGHYTSKRIMATAEDGTMIPISIVHHTKYSDLSQQPLLLYAYGSYGHAMDPYFSSARLSLLDRGVSFAIAHIRGGSEYGHQWYEQGKFLHKKNTFTDFISCGEHLIANGLVQKDQLFAMGGSAGGLLMGVIINERPDLWKGIVAAVPFVDVLSTMLDASIPLTVGEYEEWGNPHEEAYYHYIKSYSPYDQVRAQDYPAMLVTSGYHDSQVQYWEPTKWVAKLRHHKTDNNVLLLHTNMEAGHSGVTGRYQVHRETAMEYAFILDQAEIQH